MRTLSTYPVTYLNGPVQDYDLDTKQGWIELRNNILAGAEIVPANEPLDTFLYKVNALILLWNQPALRENFIAALIANESDGLSGLDGFFKKAFKAVGNVAKKAVSAATGAPRLVAAATSGNVKDFKLINNKSIAENLKTSTKGKMIVASAVVGSQAGNIKSGAIPKNITDAVPPELQNVLNRLQETQIPASLKDIYGQLPQAQIPESLKAVYSQLQQGQIPQSYNQINPSAPQRLPPEIERSMMVNELNYPNYPTQTANPGYQNLVAPAAPRESKDNTMLIVGVAVLTIGLGVLVVRIVNSKPSQKMSGPQPSIKPSAKRKKKRVPTSTE